MEKFIAIAAVLLIGVLLFLFMTSKKTQKGSPNATTKKKALTDEEVDPLAEADVYLAYGRKEQAMEILEQASRKYPNRKDIADKLSQLKQKAKH